eukprot:CAMPEP_0116823344 /NCGR_PEP_ID=MMETSP0418-20121206/786_1 /TAXON_ID=1158023 /ORGANISM="Astrosyne radiata, Strain 13vi08-1A" /LENGTH=99 /DNA_ID=CAMNT_0004451587 /DNA_START=1664 /DNA_END=1963 /DNA_ORIENTATION=+
MKFFDERGCKVVSGGEKIEMENTYPEVKYLEKEVSDLEDDKWWCEDMDDAEEWYHERYEDARSSCLKVKDAFLEENPEEEYNDAVKLIGEKVQQNREQL